MKKLFYFRKNFLIVSVLFLLSALLFSCNTKAGKDDVIVVVKDVTKTDDNRSSSVTFRNSDKVLSFNYRTSLSSGDIVLVRPDDSYVVLTEDNYLDSIVLLIILLIVFFLGCWLGGNYVQKVLRE